MTDSQNPLQKSGIPISINSDLNDPRRNEICGFLDSLNKEQKFCSTDPSLLLRSGWFAIRKENRILNPDWMAQSAHSFREIHYGMIDTRTVIFRLKRWLVNQGIKRFNYKAKNIPKNRKDKIADVIKTYVADEARIQKIAEAINKIHLAFTKIAHHFKEKDSFKDTIKILIFLQINQTNLTNIEDTSYEKLVDRFESLLFEIKPRSINSHEIIDDLIAKNSFNERRIRTLCFSGSKDNKKYFFAKANKDWLKWIYNRGFLDELKKSGDPDNLYYQLPELDYLANMATEDPILVTDIIESIEISKSTLNNEVVDRFFWIVGLLPPDQIKRLLPKILSDDWVGLMSKFGKSRHEYHRMVEKLEEASDHDALLDLSKIILKVYSPEDYLRANKYRHFYERDITLTGVFDAVLKTDDPEKALRVFLDVLLQVISLSEKEGDSAFKSLEPFYLSEDIFTLVVAEKRSLSREDIDNLIAICRQLIEKSASSFCKDETSARGFYNNFIKDLPDTRTLWRLRLFSITRCPEHFKDEIREAIFRVFDAGEKYHEIEDGKEYYHTLTDGFGVLDEPVRREYVQKVFSFFGENLENKDREGWRKRDGLDMLVCVKKYLTVDEVQEIEQHLGKPLPEETPLDRPDMERMRGGMVDHQSPFALSDYQVPEIIEHLKTDWTPQVLQEEFKDDDFLKPRGAEGLGDALRADFKVRPDDYFSNIEEFFDREQIHPTYVYSLFREIDEEFRNRKTFNNEQYLSLLKILTAIKESGEATPFKKPDDKSWLSDWISVHHLAPEILRYILENKNFRSEFAENRNTIFEIIKYFFTISDSPSVDEESREDNDPSSTAINSVRGHAYTTFMEFICANSKNELSDDIKEFFRTILQDPSTAVRYQVGRYLAIPYFRDKEGVFIKPLLPKIFPKDDKRMFFAAWEGHLASSLYKELFVELQEYYEYAITVSKEEYPDRKYRRDLDESLSVHLALAFLYLDFKIGDPLFELFWSTPDAERHEEFISYIGRNCLTKDQTDDEWLKENNISKEKLLEFWAWTLEKKVPIEPKAFSGFGFWINPKKEIIPDEIVIKNFSATLKESKGEINWDYGLLSRIEDYAKKDPINTLEMIKSFLLIDGEINPNRPPYYDARDEVKDALKIIYQNPNPDLKKDIKDMINILIDKGSNRFWGLKEVFSDDQ